MEDCIFCKIVKGEIPCFKVYEDEDVLAFADINPVSSGHTLVIPKQHSANLYEISEADLTAVQKAAQKIALALKEALNPTGIASMQFSGRGVNQEVMHYHLHLVPRGQKEPQLPMTTWPIKPGDMEAIKTTAQKIAAAVK